MSLRVDDQVPEAMWRGVARWFSWTLKFPEAEVIRGRNILLFLHSEVEAADALAEHVFNPALVTG
jgi:hypothetical protein